MSTSGRDVGPTGADEAADPLEPGEAEVYAAANPARCTDPSDENRTNSSPLSELTTADGLEPVITSASGADAAAPSYTLTKS